MENTKPKAIIVGASSGIGEALAYILSQHGYSIGLMARRVAAMNQISKKIPSQSFIKFIDLTEPYPAIQSFNDLVKEMGGVDLVIINAGVRFFNEELEWDKEKKTIDVNVSGFTALATVAMQRFIEQGHGHLVGISSIAALKGSEHTPAYNASKAYMSNYLQGMQAKVQKKNLPIIVTDIQPGYIDTPMTENDKTFWMASSNTAAEQIYAAIHRHKKHAYITKRWRLIAWIMKCMPDWLFNKLF